MTETLEIRPTSFQAAAASYPKAHRASPFDLTAEEWAATRELLLLVRAELHKRLAPDGYTLGWNDQGGLHPHLHVILYAGVPAVTLHPATRGQQRELGTAEK